MSETYTIEQFFETLNKKEPALMETVYQNKLDFGKRYTITLWRLKEPQSEIGFDIQEEETNYDTKRI